MTFAPIFHRAFLPLALISLAVALNVAQAQTGDQSVDEGFALSACLSAWGDHPFGSHLTYTRMASSARISGSAPGGKASAATSHPSLVLVDPLVNERGESGAALLNPNGWYCLRVPPKVVGRVHVQLHCRAHLAVSSGGATYWGGGRGAAGVTTMGPLEVERLGCP
ncbi:MAG: hypothetical protein R3E56_16120 [Burkholderiaceae bacterium]